MAGVAICMFSFIFITTWEKSSTDGTQQIQLNAQSLIISGQGQAQATTTTIYLSVLALAAVAVAIGSIFSYQNRMKQIKLNFLNTVLIISVMGTCVYLIFFRAMPLFEAENQGAFGTGFYLVPVSLLLNSLANRFILKDEKLVRSADRLR
jgi:hypothetical protein